MNFLKNILILFILGILVQCHSTQQSVEKPGVDYKAPSKSLGDVDQTPSFPFIPQDEGVKTGTLKNGMKFFIMPNAKPENRAELRLVVKAGAIDEDPNQLGLAHFIEHMAFNGTKNFKKNELVDYLESVGSRFGPDLNAYTSFDETVYMLQVRTDDEEQLKKGFLVLSDWASGLTFDQEEVDKERGVVISEWRSRLSPDQRMTNEYLPVLLKGSRYAKRLPIGDPDIIENASLETIKKFYYHWYRPELMAVVAVGDFNQNIIEEYIYSYFNGVPVAINPRPKVSYDIPGHPNTLVKVCSDKEAAFTRVQIVHKMSEAKMTTGKDMIDKLSSSLINTMLNDRLVELTKIDNAPFIYGYANHGGSIGPMDAFTLFAVTPEGGSLRGIETLMTEARRAQVHGFNESELQRAMDKLLKEAESQLNEADKTESRKHASRLINHFLKNDPYPSAEQYHFMVNKYLPSIKMSALQERFESWLGEESRVVIVTSPEKEGLVLPSNEDILNKIVAVENSNVEAYKDIVDEGPLVQDPAPEVLVTNKSKSNNGIETWSLPNGSRIHFKPTDFNNDEIVFKAMAQGGSSTVSDEQYFSATLSPEIVRQSGLSKFSSTTLDKKLSDKKVKLYSYIGDYDQGMQGSSAISDISTLVDMVYLHFTSVRKDETAFKAFQQRMSSVYSNLNSDPRFYFNNKGQKLLYNNHPRRQLLSVDAVEKLDLDVALKVYNDLFNNPADFNFIFVGNISDEMKSIIANRLGSIPPSTQSTKRKDIGATLANSKVEKWKKGEAPKTYVKIVYGADWNPNESRKMGLRGFRDVLNIKLREALREDKGGVYGVRVSLDMPKFPNDNYQLVIGFNADPPMADDLIAEVDKVVETLVKNGPEFKDIEKVKEIAKQQYIKGFKENDFWASQIQKMIENEDDLSKIEMTEKVRLMNLMNAENIKAEGEAFLQNSRKLLMVQNPE